MSNAPDRSAVPRAMVHKKILDAAAAQPDASMAEIAETVPSTNTDLVERVLDEYGDPADVTPDPPTPGDPTMDAETSTLQSEELTEKQRETLRVITEHPEASQRDIAARLDVAAPTVSNRVNAIEGFDWADRHAIATQLLNSPPTDTEPTAMSQNGTNDEPSTTQLAARIDTIEHQLDTHSDTATTGLTIEDPALIQKILHACMAADTVTEDEELHLIEQLVH